MAEERTSESVVCVSTGSEWVDLRSTAVGEAEPGKVLDAFLRCIEDIRLAMARMVACYNSWWTLPNIVRQQNNLASLLSELPLHYLAFATGDTKT